MAVQACKVAGRSPRKAASGVVSHKPRPAVAVDAEERRRLIECCAFFRAERFRECAPGCYREQDLRAVAAEIDAAIAPRRRKARKP